MHFTLFIRRLVLGLLLIIALMTGWLLHGIILAPGKSPARVPLT